MTASESSDPPTFCEPPITRPSSLTALASTMISGPGEARSFGAGRHFRPSCMVQTQPQIVTRLTTLLSERIWFIYKQLANTLISDPLGRMYDILLMQLEKGRVPLKNGASYTFDIGPKELIGLIGLPKK